METILQTWTRPWQLAARLAVLNVRALAQYRGDFVVALVSGIAWQSSVLVFAGVLLARFHGLGGWTQADVLLIASMRLLAHGIYVLVFSNVELISNVVQDGRLDGFLMRPLPVYRQVLLSRFPLNAVGDTSAAVFLFGLTLWRLQIDWTPARVLYLTAAVIGGVFVEAAVQTVISALAFRFTSGLAWVMWADTIFASFGNYPLRILPGAARFALTFVLPVAFIAYLPAAVITGHVADTRLWAWLVLGSPTIGPACYGLARLLWNSSLRRYESLGG